MCPREVRALDEGNVVIFTDACCEKEDDKWPCGLGQTQFFSLPVKKLGRDCESKVSSK